MKLGNSDKSERRARRRLNAYKRLNYFFGVIGVALGGWLGVLATNDGGSKWAHVIRFWGAALQVVPLAGFLWAVPSQPPRSVAARGLWMTWVLCALGAALLGVTALLLQNL
jgi:hypothetical protein